jgi:cobalt-zinc-cadmium efflux system protein
MGGHHHHHGTAAGGDRGRLLAALALALTVGVVEAVTAWLSGSLALLADAGHMLLDTTGLSLTLWAVHLAQRPATARRTFGWQRAEILATAVNAGLLLFLAGFVLVDAGRRWQHPHAVDGRLMLPVAALGLGANLVALLLLRRGQRGSIPVRGAYLEVLGDLLGSVGAVAAGAVIVLTGWLRADSVASLAIGLLILPRALALLRDVADVLLEATPRGIDLDEVRRHLLTVDGVVDVHDLHAWTITSGLPVLSAHVVVDGSRPDGPCGDGVLDQLQQCLAGHFDVVHSTLQIESLTHREHEHQTHP